MRNILMFVLVIMTSLFVGLTNATAQDATPCKPEICPGQLELKKHELTIQAGVAVEKTKVEQAKAAAEAAKAEQAKAAKVEVAKLETEKVRANAYATAEAAKAKAATEAAKVEVAKLEANAKIEAAKADAVKAAACKKAEEERAHADLTAKFEFLKGPLVTNVSTAFEAVRDSNIKLDKMGNLKVKVESTIDSPAFILDWTNPEFDSQLQPYPTKEASKGKGWSYWFAVPMSLGLGGAVWAGTYYASESSRTQLVSAGMTAGVSACFSVIISALTR